MSVNGDLVNNQLPVQTNAKSCSYLFRLKFTDNKLVNLNSSIHFIMVYRYDYLTQNI